MLKRKVRVQKVEGRLKGTDGRKTDKKKTGQVKRQKTDDRKARQVTDV